MRWTFEVERLTGLPESPVSVDIVRVRAPSRKSRSLRKIQELKG